MTPQITVLFATYNGENVLPTVLDGYLAQKTKAKWSMIIVDNASTDTTRAILGRYKRLLPMTVLNHPLPGKNGALNCALPSLNGNLVIVTDDDAIPDENFIEAWYNASLTLPDYDLFGGSVTPHFLSQPPQWMIETQFHFEEIFAARSLDSGPIPAREIFGPNMAVRRHLFERGFQFDEAIGPNSATQDYPMGSETEFCTRVERHGAKAYFVSPANVRHIARPHQLERSFWIKRAYRHGLGFGLQENIQNKGQTRNPIKSMISEFKHRCRIATSLLKSRMQRSNSLAANENIWQYHWGKGYLKSKRF